MPFLFFLWCRWLAVERDAAANQAGVRKRRLLPAALVKILLVLFLGFGIVRNLPFANWLSPSV